MLSYVIVLYIKYIGDILSFMVFLICVGYVYSFIICEGLFIF